jgi:hypothetical protein
MTSIAIFNLEILKLNRNNYYLATEIEKEEKNMFFLGTSHFQ